MITFAKAVTSGYSPLGGTIVSDRVYEPFAHGDATFPHGYTFGGHPVSAAVALENLDVFEEEGLLENVRTNSPVFRSTLERLLDLPIVGDVRGDGYFFGIELVKDKATKETFDDDESERLLRGFLSKALFDAGLYCRADDRGDPVIQLAPPLTIGPSEFTEIEQILRSTLTRRGRASDPAGCRPTPAGIPPPIDGRTSTAHPAPPLPTPPLPPRAVLRPLYPRHQPTDATPDRAPHPSRRSHEREPRRRRGHVTLGSKTRPHPGSLVDRRPGTGVHDPHRRVRHLRSRRRQDQQRRPRRLRGRPRRPRLHRHQLRQDGARHPQCRLRLHLRAGVHPSRRRLRRRLDGAHRLHAAADGQRPHPAQLHGGPLPRCARLDLGRRLHRRCDRGDLPHDARHLERQTWCCWCSRSSS